jgi:signal peptidase I
MQGFFRRVVATLLFAAVVVGCSMSTDQIGETVKGSMQKTFDSDAQFKEWHLTVSRVQVLKQGDNRYQGIATVIHEGTPHDVPIDITADGSNVMWKTEPAAFAFVAQQKLQKLQDLFAKPDLGVRLNRKNNNQYQNMGEMENQLFVKAYKMTSASMQNTILIGDNVLTNLKHYKNQKPKRGDIVVYEYPEDPTKNMIHRIIAVEGDEIYIKNKKVYLNNELLFEPYCIHLDKDIIQANINPRDNFPPIIIPNDSFFVMGDNRDRSYDSRFWGFVRLDAIKGKPFFIYWSGISERIGMKLK